MCVSHWFHSLWAELDGGCGTRQCWSSGVLVPRQRLFVHSPPGFKLPCQLHQVIVARFADDELTIDFNNFVRCLVRLETLFSTWIFPFPSLRVKAYLSFPRGKVTGCVYELGVNFPFVKLGEREGVVTCVIQQKSAAKLDNAAICLSMPSLFTPPVLPPQRYSSSWILRTLGR